MIRPDLQAIAAKWVKLFRLQDRLITVSYVPNLRNPATGDTVYALLAIENEDEGRYSIFVQDPATWPKDAPRQPTQKVIEGAVRHECAHIRVRDFAPRNPSDADILAEERAVWAISDAFDAVGDAPRFAAMVVQQLTSRPNSFFKIAANVRAMAATAAVRPQRKGQPVDIMLILAALEAALSAEDPKTAISALIEKVKPLVGAGDSAAPSTPDPMNQEAGAVDPNKDKPSDTAPMMRAMKADMVEIRAMKAELKEALDVARPAAKTELVRTMRVDGITLLPHQEKQIIDAADLPTAKAIAQGMRAMALPGQARKACVPADGSGLTPTQDTKYRGMVAANNPRAEVYRDECVRKNAQDKKAGAK